MLREAYEGGYAEGVLAGERAGFREGWERGGEEGEKLGDELGRMVAHLYQLLDDESPDHLSPLILSKAERLWHQLFAYPLHNQEDPQKEVALLRIRGAHRELRALLGNRHAAPPADSAPTPTAGLAEQRRQLDF